MASEETSLSNFGNLIGYVLPGFVALKGLPYLPISVLAQQTDACLAEQSVAGFLYGTIEAVTAGLTVSAVRWLLLDMLHHRTGLQPPLWDFGLLEENVTAFELLVHIHYRYYKFYANMVVALISAYALGGYALGWRGLVYWVLAALFLAASRDALGKYYGRAGRLLGARRENDRDR